MDTRPLQEWGWTRIALMAIGLPLFAVGLWGFDHYLAIAFLGAMLVKASEGL